MQILDNLTKITKKNNLILNFVLQYYSIMSVALIFTHFSYLNCRTQALMKLESCLTGLQSELEHIREVSQSENCDVSVNREVEDLWEVTTKVVSER